eukprot:g7963.t1
MRSKQSVCVLAGLPGCRTDGTMHKTMRIATYVFILFFAVCRGEGAPPCGVLDVMKFGAKGDGVTLDTIAIQTAFDTALNRKDCTILFPSGHVYYTGPLNITKTGNENIRIEEGAVLRFSSDRRLHPKILDPHVTDRLRYQPLLFCEFNCPNVSLTGGGTIDGQGDGWWPPVPSGMKPSKNLIPPVTVECTWCDNFKVEDIIIKECPFVCLHINNSTNAYVYNITITNPIDSPNTACVYADGLKNSHITKSRFSCGDDHITVLAMTTKTVNLLIDESEFYHGQGLTLGSQVFHGMENVIYRNIIMHGGLTGIRLKSQRGKGGKIEGLVYENIQLRSVGIMMSVEMDYHHTGIVSANPPSFNGVVLRNITGWGDLAGYMSCLPESPCKGWKFENVFPDSSSEVVLPYHCNEHFIDATCENCGAWPKLCPGMTSVGDRSQSL